MKHLFDTSTLFNKLSSPSDIIKLGQEVQRNNQRIVITDVVRDELEPHRYLEKNELEKSTGIIQVLDLCKEKSYGITTINIGDDAEYKKNYNNIRKRYYSHISSRELQKQVRAGKITEKDAKSLKKKDCGECSCIAIAMTDPKNIYIVSEDEGRVCNKPEINIFNIYRKSHNLKVFKFISWLDMGKIQY